MGTSGGSLDRSWGALDHFRRPKLVQIGLQDAFGSDVGAKGRIYKKYWKTHGQTHIFDPKMAPKCRKMAPRWFQEPSWPLLVALGPPLGLLRAILGRREAIWGPLRAILERSWSVLARTWGLWGRSWGVIGGSWGDLGRPRGVKIVRWRRCSRAGWPPLETFCESFFLQGT